MKSNARPIIVTWLIVGVLFFSILFIIRLALSIQMPDLPTSVPRWYLPLTGAFWGTVGLVMSYSLFRGKSWAPKLLSWGSVGFTSWYWLDRLIFVQSDYGHSIWPAVATFNLLALIFIFLSQRRIDVKAYFQEKLDE